MASDGQADVFATAALDKIAEFRRIRYPLSVLSKCCTFLGASTGVLTVGEAVGPPVDEARGGQGFVVREGQHGAVNLLHLVAVLGEECLDVVVDNVAGDDFGQFLKLLKRGGRYVSSGAIAGPIVKMDLRDMYLKDIRLIGCTAWDEPVFANLIRYIERGEIKPMVARTFRLADIAQAQQEFLNKEFVGKFVLLP